MSPTLGAVLLFICWVLATIMYVVATDEHKLWVTVFMFGPFVLLGVLALMYEAGKP